MGGQTARHLRRIARKFDLEQSERNSTIMPMITITTTIMVIMIMVITIIIVIVIVLQTKYKKQIRKNFIIQQIRFEQYKGLKTSFENGDDFTSLTRF